MRYFYIALIVVITAAVLTFKIQNISSVTVSFLAASVTLPLSVLVFGVYFLGMFTGGLLVNVAKSVLRKARNTVPGASH